MPLTRISLQPGSTMALYESDEDGEKKMDFARFLSTGELSDISVTVDTKVFHLHKFPLYTKSDFFRALARSSTPADKDHVTLTDFPGGPTTFELITNYCYNVRIKVTPDNVCQLRCAAEFLQMTGPGNLAGAADRVLESTLTSASLERRLDSVVGLVLQCRQLGAIAEQAGVIGKCVKAIVDSWLSASAFTRSYSANQPSVDKEILVKLTTFPLDWFTELLQVARDKYVSASVSAALIELYISNALDLDDAQGGRQDEKRGQGQAPAEDRLGRKQQATRRESVQEEKGKREERNGKEDETKEEQEKEENEDEEDEEEKAHEEEEEEEKVASRKSLEGDGDTNEDEISPIESARDDEEDEEEEKEKEKKNEEEEEEEEVEEEEMEEEEEDEDEVESIREQHPDKALTASAIGDDEISTILDTLLCDFPEAVAVLSGIVTPKWVLAVLAKARELDLRSKDVLIEMVARLLSRFTDEDLSQLSPDVFVLVLKETCRENAEVEIPPNQICRTVDSYLKGISSQGALNHDVFRQIVEAVPEKYKANEDTFFHVLEKLLQSETNDLSEAERESLLDSVDYSRLTDSALQAAFDSKLVPVHHIARAALRLCSQLRGELTAAKAVIEQQEQELFKIKGAYGSGRSRWATTGSTGSRRTDGGTDGGDRSARRVDSNRESLPSSSYRPASTRSRSRSYGTGTGTTATGSHHLSGSSYYHNTNPGNPYIPTLATELELRLALSCLGDDQLEELRYGNSSTLTHHPLITSSSAGLIHDFSAYDDFDSNFSYYRPLPSAQNYSRKYYSKHSSH